MEVPKKLPLSEKVECENHQGHLPYLATVHALTIGVIFQTAMAVDKAVDKGDPFKHHARR